MTKHLPLSGGVNAGGLISDGILMKNSNHRAFVGVDDSSTGSNLDGGHAVVVNAFNVNFSMGHVLVKLTDVTSAHATIGTTIHKGRLGSMAMGGHTIGDAFSHGGLNFAARAGLTKNTTNVMRRQRFA